MIFTQRDVFYRWCNMCDKTKKIRKFKKIHLWDSEESFNKKIDKKKDGWSLEYVTEFTLCLDCIKKHFQETEYREHYIYHHPYKWIEKESYMVDSDCDLTNPI